MRSMWIGAVLIALATSAWANGKDTATKTREQEQGKGVTPGRRSTTVVVEERRGGRPNGNANPNALRLSKQGLRGWQDGATSYGFTRTEVVQANQQQQIGGRTVGWWAERARANLQKRQLPSSHMNLPKAELTNLLARNIIDESDFLAIGYARGESW